MATAKKKTTSELLQVCWGKGRDGGIAGQVVLDPEKGRASKICFIDKKWRGADPAAGSEWLVELVFDTKPGEYKGAFIVSPVRPAAEEWRLEPGGPELYGTRRLQAGKFVGLRPADSYGEAKPEAIAAKVKAANEAFVAALERAKAELPRFIPNTTRCFGEMRVPVAVPGLAGALQSKLDPQPDGVYRFPWTFYQGDDYVIGGVGERTLLTRGLTTGGYGNTALAVADWRKAIADLGEPKAINGGVQQYDPIVVVWLDADGREIKATLPVEAAVAGGFVHSFESVKTDSHGWVRAEITMPEIGVRREVALGGPEEALPHDESKRDGEDEDADCLHVHETSGTCPSGPAR